jgi:hypothetical protein
MVSRWTKFLCLAGILALSHPGAATAALVSKDFLAPGDGLLTLDTDTNLEWLDLTQTLAQTYNAVATGFGGYTTTYGFSIATTTQVSQLFTNGGLPMQDANFYASQFGPAVNFLSLFGCTHTCGVNGEAAQGWLDFDPALPVTASSAYVQLDNVGATARAAVVFVPAAIINNKDHSLADSGVFLVRPSEVPLPAALPLFASGLGVAGFVGWLRRRKLVRA